MGHQPTPGTTLHGAPNHRMRAAPCTPQSVLYGRLRRSEATGNRTHAHQTRRTTGYSLSGLGILGMDKSTRAGSISPTNGPRVFIETSCKRNAQIEKIS